MTRDRKHVMMFALFSLYLAVCLTGYGYIGETVFYFSLPLIFGASAMYGYLIGFVSVVLNIPAMILFMYVAGTPASIAVRELNAFIILLQCVCVVIPGLIRSYFKKKDMQRNRDNAGRIDSLIDEIESVKEEKDRYIKENEELKLIAERYKELLDQARDKDSVTGLASREAVIRKIQRYLAVEEDKAYIFIRFPKLRETNMTEGIFRGDEYLREKAAILRGLAAETGRISNSSFVLIVDAQTAESMLRKITDLFREEAMVMSVIPEKEDRITDIFARWDGRIT